MGLEDGRVAAGRCVEGDAGLRGPSLLFDLLFVGAGDDEATSADLDVVWTSSGPRGPSARLGSTTSVVYLGVLKEWSSTPWQSSPATLSIRGFTAATYTFMSGSSIGPGLKNGGMRSIR